MLAQLPPHGFPGSLTIFLLSPISSSRNCSNRGDIDGGDTAEGLLGMGSYAVSIRVGAEGQIGDRVALAIWCAPRAKLI